MSDDAREFLEAWTVARTDTRPLTRDEAAMLAEQWTMDAADNGLTAEALEVAAEGSVTDYLLRTYGEEGAELSTDGGDHSAGAPTPPREQEDWGF